jgi:hypothetical protein
LHGLFSQTNSCPLHIPFSLSNSITFVLYATEPSPNSFAVSTSQCNAVSTTDPNSFHDSDLHSVSIAEYISHSISISCSINVYKLNANIIAILDTLCDSICCSDNLPECCSVGLVHHSSYCRTKWISFLFAIHFSFLDTLCSSFFLVQPVFSPYFYAFSCPVSSPDFFSLSILSNSFGHN